MLNAHMLHTHMLNAHALSPPQDVMRLLLDAGAKPDMKDNFGGTAMLEAVKQSQDEAINLLLAYGGRWEDRGMLWNASTWDVGQGRGG